MHVSPAKQLCVWLPKNVTTMHDFQKKMWLPDRQTDDAGDTKTVYRLKCFQYDRIFSNISKCIYIVMKLVYGKAFLGHFFNFQWIMYRINNELVFNSQNESTYLEGPLGPERGISFWLFNSKELFIILKKIPLKGLQICFHCLLSSILFEDRIES